MENRSGHALEEPMIMNALFKYAILQAEKLRLKDYVEIKETHNEYLPDTNAIHKILRENPNLIPNPLEVCERLPSKKLCPLEPHEYLQQLLL